MPRLLQHRHEGAADVAVVPGYEYLHANRASLIGFSPRPSKEGRRLPDLQPLLVPKRVTRNEGKAIFAVACTMIVVVWHILSSDGATYQDLGPGYFERRN